MEHRRPIGLRYLVVWFGCVVLMSSCVTLFADASYGQPERRGVPIGVEGIKRMLIGHKQWTLYWDRAPVSRPRRGSATTDRSPSATLEFTRGCPVDRTRTR